MTLSFAIPNHVAAELGGSAEAVEARVLADLAVHYYEARLVPRGRACEMSGLRRQDFEALLAERRSVRDYAMDDLATDLAWANG